MEERIDPVRPSKPVISVVAAPDAGLAALTYGRFVEGWSKAPERHLAVAVCIGTLPIGLALIYRRDAEPEARLLSIMVRKPFRRAGLGSSLLQRASSAAAAAGVARLVAYHNDRNAGRAAFEALLAGAGWSPPAEFEQRVAGHCGQVYRHCRNDWPRFFAEKEAQGSSIDPWSGVTQEETRDIAARIEAGELAKVWDPALTARYSHSDLSLAIRRAGRLVGWLFGEAVPGTDQINYFNGFVFPGHQRAGWLIYGLVEVLGRQAELLGPSSVAVYATAGENRAMRGFMDRRLSAVTLWADRRFRSTKDLTG